MPFYNIFRRFIYINMRFINNYNNDIFNTLIKQAANKFIEDDEEDDKEIDLDDLAKDLQLEQEPEIKPTPKTEEKSKAEETKKPSINITPINEPDKKKSDEEKTKPIIEPKSLNITPVSNPLTSVEKKPTKTNLFIEDNNDEEDEEIDLNDLAKDLQLDQKPEIKPIPKTEEKSKIEEQPKQKNEEKTKSKTKKTTPNLSNFNWLFSNNPQSDNTQQNQSNTEPIIPTFKSLDDNNSTNNTSINTEDFVQQQKNVDNEIAESASSTEDKKIVQEVSKISSTITDILRNPDKYKSIIDIKPDDLTSEDIKEDEDKNVDTLNSDDIEDLFNTEIKIEPPQKPAEETPQVGIVNSETDLQIINDYFKDETINGENIEQLFTETSDNIQGKEMISEQVIVDQERTNFFAGEKASLKKKKEIGFESKLDTLTSKLNNPQNDIINTFTTDEELKTYITEQMKKNNISADILNNPITYIHDLKQIISTVYNSAFKNNSLVDINMAFEAHIKDVIDKYIMTLRKNMFDLNTLRNTLNAFPKPRGGRTADDDPILQHIETFIRNRMLRVINGKKNNTFDNVLNAYATDTKQIRLFPLLNTCAMKYCLDKQNNTLRYDDSKNLDSISTEMLFQLRKRSNTTSISSTNIDSDNAQIHILNQRLSELYRSNHKKYTSYINNYQTQLRRLITPNLDKKFGFERMSWKGFNYPLQFYRNLLPPQQVQLLEYYGEREYTYITKKNLELYTNLNLRISLATVYKNLLKYMIEDLHKLKNMEEILKSFQLTLDTYQQMASAHDFRESPIFGFTSKNIPIKFLDPYANINLKYIKEHRTQQASNKNRILVRIAIAVNMLWESDITKFYQQPYAKYLISLLCGTSCLASSNRMTWQMASRPANHLDSKKLKIYIKNYLATHKDMLNELQNQIIEKIKLLLQNDKRLFDLLPKINLIEQLNAVAGIEVIDTTYKNMHDLFNSNIDLIKYIIWHFSNKGHKNNEFLQYYRRYILQPRVIEVLNQYLPKLIEKFELILQTNQQSYTD